MRWCKCSGAARLATSFVATVLVAGALVGAGLGAGDARAEVRPARGFDGKTVVVAGLGIKSSFPGAETGARARVKKFNDTNELPGIKIDYSEFADDKQDPATALSEVRRLVTQGNVFALVGDVSQFNPGDYLVQQKVPYFGWAFDNSYCSPSLDTDAVWGFGYNGCLTPDRPKKLPDTYANLYTYAREKLGKKRLTVAAFGNDTATSKNVMGHLPLQLNGAGFETVYSGTDLPVPPIPDYTPYVQKILTADNGHAPDVIVCMLATDCIAMYDGIRATGWSGVYFSNLYSDFLLKPLEGSVASVTFAPFDTQTAGLTDMQKWVGKVDPSAKLDTGVFSSWASTDMFIQALEAAKKSGGISPQNVHDQAMHQTWQIKGFAGPTKYPAALGGPTPACSALTLDTGTVWQTVTPYGCSTKTYVVK